MFFMLLVSYDKLFCYVLLEGGDEFLVHSL